MTTTRQRLSGDAPADPEGRGVGRAGRPRQYSVRPAPAFAAANDKYPEDAFKQKSEADAIKALYGKTAEKSDKVKLEAPEIAENGAVVPISVTTTLADVTSISFLVSENPNALAASYRIPAGTMPAWPTG